MKLKKPMTVKAPRPAAAASAAGGATIADRFKLDNVAPMGAAAPAQGGSKTAALLALIVALAGLAVSGFLAYTLYEHSEFLKTATSLSNS